MEASPTIIYQDVTGESQSATSTIKALLELQQTSGACLTHVTCASVFCHFPAVLTCVCVCVSHYSEGEERRQTTTAHHRPESDGSADSSGCGEETVTGAVGSDRRRDGHSH